MSHFDSDDSNARPPKQAAWRRYLRMIRPDPRGDLDDELRDHLESAIETLVSRGMSPEDARAEALRRFGDVSRVRAEVQRLDTDQLMRTNRMAALETLMYDLRHAMRALRRNPAFTFVAT